MNEPTQDLGQAVQADKQAVASVTKSLDDQYAEMLKKEQDALLAKQQGEAAMSYENVRKLGFITKNDMDETIKGIFGKFAAEVESMRQENTKLREWVMRAKAQGLASGASDEPDSSEISADVRRFLPEWQKKRR